MSNLIDPNTFIVSLSIGLLITYLILPTPKVIIRYPNLSNIDNVTYVDNKGVCYKYNKESVNCDFN